MTSTRKITEKMLKMLKHKNVKTLKASVFISEKMLNRFMLRDFYMRKIFVIRKINNLTNHQV